jgi:hypothetical protein
MLDPSVSSDEDLRAIKVQLEELLDSTKPERTIGTRPESEMALPLSSGKIIVYIAKMFPPSRNSVTFSHVWPHSMNDLLLNFPHTF